jgi:site-specific recombinase
LAAATARKDMPAADHVIQQLRHALTQCRQAVASIHAHMDQFGISVDVIFVAHQLRERTQRMEQLLHTLTVPVNARLQPIVHLLSRVMHQDQQRRGLRALFAHHYSMLSRKVAERSGDIGTHYITSSRHEYWDMLRRALIGGGVLALTTFLKLMIGALGLSLFWGGWWAGCNYALSFVAIHLLHGVVATKQPAMTAATLASSLRHIDDEQGIRAFVMQFAQLVR